MKFSSIIFAAAAVVDTTNAFAPVAPRAVVGAPLAPLAMAKVPFFAQDGVDEPYDPDADDEPELEEVPEATVATAVVDKSAQDKAYADEDNELEEDAVRKLKKASKMKTAGGVAYAPWMNISADEEDEIRKVMKSKSQARRKRQAEEASASGALVMDSQAQELSGGGLQTKIIDGAVELEWTTNSEASTKGYLVKRRAARTEEFEVIASYEDFGPLASKGPDGGAYRYLDSNITPGGWVYRITECEASGSTNDICQALVDVQTEEEQRGALIAAVSISAIAVAAVVAGIFLDPVGGY